MSIRGALLEAHATTTPADLAFALKMAETPAEVDQAAHLTLLLFGGDLLADVLYRPFTEHGREFAPLHKLVAHHRNRVDGYGPERARAAARLDNALAHAGDRRRREAGDVRAKREEKIRRFGFVNAERL